MKPRKTASHFLLPGLQAALATGALLMTARNAGLDALSSFGALLFVIAFGWALARLMHALPLWPENPSPGQSRLLLLLALVLGLDLPLDLTGVLASLLAFALAFVMAWRKQGGRP